MKKTLNRALLKKAQATRESGSDTNEGAKTEEPKSFDPGKQVPGNTGVGGAGSAWKAGAAEQNKAALARSREQMVEDILAGSHELLLDADQVFDRIGSDRRDDWLERETVQNLRGSIEKDGQDTPIQVWPSDPNWKPDLLDATNVEGIKFDLITGRRRHAVSGMLGKKVRAILASPEKRGTVEEQFERLFIRFRENEERENLGPFERLCSIGEMFEELLANHSGTKPTAVSFAERINVHESIVSRGRAVFKAREQILNKFKNVYDMSYPELQKAVSSLTEKASDAKDSKAKPKKINVTKKVGSRNLLLSSQAGKLSISTSGLTLNKGDLEELGAVIADHLNKLRSK